MRSETPATTSDGARIQTRGEAVVMVGFDTVREPRWTEWADQQRGDW